MHLCIHYFNFVSSVCVYVCVCKRKPERNTAKKPNKGFPGGAVVENLPANAGDTGSRPGVGGSHMPWSN